jgi:hypothetical protein
VKIWEGLKTSEWLAFRESGESSELERKTLKAGVMDDLRKVLDRKVMSG